MAATRVYYAAPLFTAAQRAWNAANAARLRDALPRIELLMPQEFCASFEAADTADHGSGRLGKPDFPAIFKAGRDRLHSAGYCIAILDGTDVDSGTAWEVGYAHARGTVVVGLRTDWRPGEDDGVNCMLRRSCAMVVGDLDGVITCLKGWLR